MKTIVSNLSIAFFVKMGLGIFLIYFGFKFIWRDALPLFAFTEEAMSHYWEYRWSVIGHVSGGIVALLIGPFQLWPAFRNSYTLAHRRMGYLYLMAILIGSISGTHLAWTTALESNFAFAFAMQMLAIVWFGTTAMAYISIRKREIDQHREWMIRSYVVTMAFIVFRWLAGLGLVRELMPKFIERGPTITWMCWVIPLMITEFILIMRRAREKNHS
jgi:uncharacterized membrane protein